MQKLHSIALPILLSLSAVADTVDVFIGTSGGDAQGIYHATFDPETGKLSPATLAAETGNPGFLALNSRQDRLYAVATEDEPAVVAYRIGEGGELERLNAAPIGDGRGTHVAVHPSDKFLLTAQYGGGSVAVFPLADDGSVLSRVQIVEHEGASNVVPERQDRPHPHWVGYSPDGHYAFVPDLGADRLFVYGVNAGEPSITRRGHARSVPGGGPRHMRFSADGRFIYLLNELSLSVTAFSWDAAQGSAGLVGTVPALGEEARARESYNSASEILVHPNGRFVYSANRGHDSVTVFNTDPDTGIPAVREVEPIRGSWPRNINLDPTGRWLLAAGAHSNTVSVFAIDPETGELTFQPRSIINVPRPYCIVFRK